MTIEKQLDALLEFHRQYKHGQIFSVKENPYGLSESVYDEESDKLKYKEIERIIIDFELMNKNNLIEEMYRQLRHDDKYISTDEYDNFRLTVRGLKFCGYEKELENKIQDREIKENYDERLEGYARYLNFGTWFLGGVTVLLVLFEILKWYYECPCH